MIKEGTADSDINIFAPMTKWKSEGDAKFNPEGENKFIREQLDNRKIVVQPEIYTSEENHKILTMKPSKSREEKIIWDEKGIRRNIN